MSLLPTNLGEHISFSNGKTSPERKERGSYPVFGSNGLIGFAEDANAPEGTTIIGRVGSYCGSVHFSKNASWVTDNAIKAVAKEPDEARFWFYALQTLRLHDLRSGSGQPLINQTSLKSVVLHVPTPLDRAEIANLLGSLDDKIDLNRRTNETLEAMAQAIFRDWFVDFGPTRRKLAGITDPLKVMGGLVQDAARAATLKALFPATFADNGLPEGWEEYSLGDVASRSGGIIQTGPFGSQLHKADYEASGVPVIMPTNLTYSEVVEEGIARVSQQTADRLERHKLRAGDIIYGRRGDIGRKAQVSKTQEGWLCGTGCLRISICSRELPTSFLFYQLDLDETHEWLRSRAVGATMPNLNTSILGEIPIVVPGSELTVAFETIARPLQDKVAVGRAENQTLAATRDLLLPKLMSGEIRLADAEAIAEDAL